MSTSDHVKKTDEVLAALEGETTKLAAVAQEAATALERFSTEDLAVLAERCSQMRAELHEPGAVSHSARDGILRALPAITGRVTALQDPIGKIAIMTRQFEALGAALREAVTKIN